MGIGLLCICNRLIPLSKNPGVRPIGVCETLRRIIGKAIMVLIGPEIQSVAGTAQLCARQRSGCEAAVHAMKKLYSGDSEGVLLVDASNAFNSLNRRVMLHNIQRLCPAFATCVINYYRSSAQLFVGGETLLSAEGTTQGDPLSKAIYALGTLPLVSHAKTADVTQAWFADDASAEDKLIQLHKWWTILAEVGPHYGCFVNAPKTWLVVKENLYEVAVSLFGSTGVQIIPLKEGLFSEVHLEQVSTPMTLFERRSRNGKWKLKSWPKLREWIRNLRMPRTPTHSRTSGSISLELWKTVMNTLVYSGIGAS